MTVFAFIQARMSSSRLPQKVLQEIQGKSMLCHQILRLQHCQNIDKIIILTSDQTEDDAIEHESNMLNVPCFRGDLDNVLSRFYHAALQWPSSHIVRLTADCPLIDASVVDTVIKQHIDSAADYTSNCMTPSYPDGLDVEVISYDTLQKTYHNAILPSELEHVTPYIRNNPELFSISEVNSNENLSHHRWTVDEQVDLKFVKHIYDALFPSNPTFSTQDILNLLDSNPELTSINNNIERNEGFSKSLEKDKELENE